ncbi:hypothetical protein BGX24_010916 [Mortierella sp. AD032]|nr:hypothetical protein BGX24_010916 [Mortierella sp. AD032]
MVEFEKIPEVFERVELDIRRWENIYAELNQQSIVDDKEQILLFSWVVTRLQYLRALYPVMDANRFDYDLHSYYDGALKLIDVKGPDSTTWFCNNTHFVLLYSNLISKNHRNPSIKHPIGPSVNTPAPKKSKTELASATISGTGISNTSQVSATAHSHPSAILALTSTGIPSGSTVTKTLSSGSTAAVKPSTTTTSTTTTSVTSAPPASTTALQPHEENDHFEAQLPQHIHESLKNRDDDTQYPSPVGSVSPGVLYRPKAKSASSKTATASAAVASMVPSVSESALSIGVGQLEQRQQPRQSLQSGEHVSDMVDAEDVEDAEDVKEEEEEEVVGASTEDTSSQDQQLATADRKPDTQQKQHQPKQPMMVGKPLLDKKKDADEIIDAPADNKSPQGHSDILVASNPALALRPQDHQQTQPTQQPLEQPLPQQQQPQQLQQHRAPKPLAAVDTTRAEVNPSTLLLDIKTWMEKETNKRKDETALLERLIIKNTLLETKLDEHITKTQDEAKKQEVYRAKTHSWDQVISSLKERTLVQDLKMSQMENQVESRMRQTLEQDIMVVRNELQEERVDNLTKDLEIRRAEAMETMAKARAEMRDARQMVAEAREERANAMERAARAEADNQMLLRVINQLQGTGWRLPGEVQQQQQRRHHHHHHGQLQDAGVQNQDQGGPSISSTTIHPTLQFDHHPRPLVSGSSSSSSLSSSSRFMRFGATMRQSFSSSSTESLMEAPTTAVADPTLDRMEMISVKLENEFIGRLHVDPDMTEDDEGRTDTDGDATEEE